MRHILFLSYDGLTDPLGQSQILPYLIGLSKHGYRFTIISNEKPGNFAIHKQTVVDAISKVAINWIPLKYHKSPPIVSAIYDLRLMKKASLRLYKKDPFHMVHARSGTPSIVALFLKKRLSIKFLNDIRDFYSYSKVDSGQWSQQNPVYRAIFRYFKNHEENQLMESDGIVCLTRKANNVIMASGYFTPGTPISVIPCSVDLELFNPSEIDLNRQVERRQQLGFRDGDKIVTYLGSVGTWYLIEEMLSFFRTLKKSDPELKILIISPDKPDTIRSIARQVGLDRNDIFITQANRSEIPLLLSLSYLSIFFIKPCYSKQASSPTKLGEIMAMGIPVITNSGVGDVQEIVSQCKSGYVLDDLSEANFEAVSWRLQSDCFSKDHIRNGARNYFDLEDAVNRYAMIYGQILQPEKFNMKLKLANFSE